jgi:gliding motility associated protien GldN
MRRVVLLLLAILMFVPMLQTGTNAQDLKKEVYVNEHIPFKEPIPYPHVREADVMWSKIIWRIVDLREKQNHALYYPTKPIGKRMNLTDMLLWGIENEGIRAYATDDWLNEFKVPMTKEGIDFAFDALPDTQQVLNVNTNILEEVVIPGERHTDEIKKFLIKEKWYFDKQHSTMQVQIIGICPIRVYFRKDDNGMPTEDIRQTPTFWVYYPEARNLLSKGIVYNRHNDAQQISFDDFMQQRRFSSYIYAESNVFDNRLISEYTVGLNTLYESERIKNDIFTFEHDLWEY